jgi:hypothetical protein
MGRKLLENVRMGRSAVSWVAAAEGVLRAAGWWHDEPWKLTGATGMGFMMIMHHQACISSATVYPWGTDHVEAMDRIGVYTEAYEGWPALNSFTLMQQRAAERIKASIDRGMAVVAWSPTHIPEFGILTGYDDGDGVFDVSFWPDTDGEADPLLYGNLGRMDVPALFYQVFEGRVDVDPEKMHRDALEHGVNAWRRQNERVAGYAEGRRAYDTLLATLERRDFRVDGLCYNLSVYGCARDDLARYLGYVARETGLFPDLAPAVAAYERVADRYVRLREMLPFHPRESVVPDECLPEVSRLVRECRDLEDEGIAAIERALEA